MEQNTTNKSTFYYPTSYLIGEVRRPAVRPNRFDASQGLTLYFSFELPNTRRIMEFSINEYSLKSGGEVVQSELFNKLKNVESGVLLILGVCYAVTTKDDKVYYNSYVQSAIPYSDDIAKVLNRSGLFGGKN